MFGDDARAHDERACLNRPPRLCDHSDPDHHATLAGFVPRPPWTNRRVRCSGIWVTCLDGGGGRRRLASAGDGDGVEISPLVRYIERGRTAGCATAVGWCRTGSPYLLALIAALLLLILFPSLTLFLPR